MGAGGGPLALLVLLGLAGWGSAAKGRAGSYVSFDPTANLLANRTVDRLEYLRGPQLILHDPNRLMQRQTFTLEGLVRIRDERLFNDAVDRPLVLRVPIMGNFQIRRPDSDPQDGSGWGISCYKDVGQEPRCCFDVWLGSFVAAVPVRKQVCINVRWASSQEWFHIAAAYDGGAGYMRVQAIRLNGEPTSMAELQETALQTTDASLQGIRYLHSKTQAGIFATDTWAPFRIGHYIEADNRGVMYNKANTVYQFFKGDVDEVRFWTELRSERQLRDAAWETYEDIPPTLAVYLPIRDCAVVTGACEPAANVGAAASILGTRAADLSVVPGFQENQGIISPYPSQQAWLRGVAYGVQIATAADSTCTVTNQLYPPTCGQNYFDRRAGLHVGALSSGASLGPTAPASGPAVPVEVNLLQHSQTITADVMVADFNREDTVFLDPADPVLLIPNWGATTRYLDEGMPFSMPNVPRPTQDEVFNPITLPANIVEIVKVGGADPVPSGVLTCANCVSSAGSAPCNCAVVRFKFAGVYPSEVCNTDLADRPELNALCTEWWVPAGINGQRGGFHVRFVFTELQVRPTASTGLPRLINNARMTANVLMRYEASPEWLSVKEYPLRFASDPNNVEATVSTALRVAAITPYEGVAIPARVGEVVRYLESSIAIRVRDRNLGDWVDVYPLDDPGLPNGARLEPDIFNSDLQRCFARYQTLDRGPPIFQRNLLWTPTKEQIGTHRLCFRAESYPANTVALTALELAALPEFGNDFFCCPRFCPTNTDSSSQYTGNSKFSYEDRCFTVEVLTPDASFDPPVGPPGSGLNPEDGAELEFRAGCADSVAFSAKDLSAQLYTATASGDAPEPTAYDIVFRLEPGAVGGGLPEGLAVAPGECPFGAPPGAVCWLLSWNPRLGGEERTGGYAVCVLATESQDIVAAPPKRCYTVRVKKCQYCMNEGDTLHSVGAQLGTDWLHVYMANPTLRNPDSVGPGTIVNTGVVYKVRPGDYMELLAEKFYDSVENLRKKNTDIPEDGLIQPGMEICVMPPVCNVQCLYGTDCHIF